MFLLFIIYYYFLILASGDVYSWGYGVLGHGQEIPFTKIPQKIQAFDNMEEVVIGVSCGPDYSAAVTGWCPVSSGYVLKVQLSTKSSSSL